MSLCKASFGLLTTTMTNWWAPTVIRSSGDASVANQLKLTSDGRVECDFPDRLVMIANHQVRSKPTLHYPTVPRLLIMASPTQKAGFG